MDTGNIAIICAFAVPIVAIVLGIGLSFSKKWMGHQQEMARIRASSGLSVDQSSQRALEELRSEIAQLRDTTTKYYISVETALDEIRHRLSVVESRTGASYRPATNQEQQTGVSQNVGG